MSAVLIITHDLVIYYTLPSYILHDLIPQTVIGEMPEGDQFLIYELMSAMEAGQFLANSQSTMRLLPSTPEEFVNLAETFIRKVIKMAKHVTYFKQLHKDDQISLLKVSGGGRLPGMVCLARNGSDWPQMAQIRGFFRSDFSAFGAPRQMH